MWLYTYLTGELEKRYIRSICVLILHIEIIWTTVYCLQCIFPGEYHEAVLTASARAVILPIRKFLQHNVSEPQLLSSETSLPLVSMKTLNEFY